MKEGKEGKNIKPLILIHLDVGKENLLELLQSYCKRFVLVFYLIQLGLFPSSYVYIVASSINRFIYLNKYIVEEKGFFLSLARFHSQNLDFRTRGWRSEDKWWIWGTLYIPLFYLIFFFLVCEENLRGCQCPFVYFCLWSMESISKGNFTCP